MRLAFLVVAVVFCAGAAYSQDNQCLGAGGSNKASKAFVDAFNAATQALQNRDWTGALNSASQARPFAMGGSQVAAVIQIQIAAIAETEDKATFAAALEAAKDTPCLPDQVRDYYVQRLRELGDGTASQQ